ncbi:MAG: DUF2887 domain-containing protein [Phormidesmis sp.]
MKRDSIFHQLFRQSPMLLFELVSRLYFYRNCKQLSDWQVVVIYPARSTKQSRLHPHRSLLNGEQVHRIFLNELGNIRELHS